MDEGMVKGIRELENMSFSLSSLLITLQLNWENLTFSRKPCIRPLRYQHLPMIEDFPHLEVGQCLEGLLVHEK